MSTTGVLIGFALLLLVVVSALLAFRGWPGDTAVAGAGAVSVDTGGRLIHIGPPRLAGGAPATDGPAAAAAASSARGRARANFDGGGGAGGVGGVNESGTADPGHADQRIGSTDQSGDPPAPARPGGGAATGGIADGAEGTTGAAGEALGEVGAPGGDGLSQAGQGVSDAVSGAGGAVQQNSALPSPVVPLPSR